MERISQPVRNLFLPAPLEGRERRAALLSADLLVASPRVDASRMPNRRREETKKTRENGKGKKNFRVKELAAENGKGSVPGGEPSGSLAKIPLNVSFVGINRAH